MRLKIEFSNYDNLNNPYHVGSPARFIHEIAKRYEKQLLRIVVWGAK